ncbi:hypothetical protein BT69DRAFT_25506 [Atractiella rhizophila]|nr:hypothetical protein BT69DRAFT_25506 [Atractiella rhizophila]
MSQGPITPNKFVFVAPTKPNQRRVRASTACTRCHRLKVKCIPSLKEKPALDARKLLKPLNAPFVSSWPIHALVPNPQLQASAPPPPWVIRVYCFLVVPIWRTTRRRTMWTPVRRRTKHIYMFLGRFRTNGTYIPFFNVSPSLF